MRYAVALNVISVVTFALAVFFLLHRGLHLSVEFTGGTVMEVAYTQPADVGKVRETITKLGYADVQVVAALTEYDPQRGGFLVTFKIEEGQQYRVGSVDFQRPPVEPTSTLPAASKSMPRTSLRT